MEEFKRIVSLVWRCFFAVVFVALLLTRLADLVLPLARTGWIGFCARQSIPYSQVMVAQLATVVLSGWLLWVHSDSDRFKSAWGNLEYIGILGATNFFTRKLYSSRSQVETGVVPERIAESVNVQFWLAIILLVLFLCFNPAIEFIFREKKVKEA